jgi:hypothetical protein
MSECLCRGLCTTKVQFSVIIAAIGRYSKNNLSCFSSASVMSFDDYEQVKSTRESGPARKNNTFNVFNI